MSIRQAPCACDTEGQERKAHPAGTWQCQALVPRRLAGFVRCCRPAQPAMRPPMPMAAAPPMACVRPAGEQDAARSGLQSRSEEHTSELQSLMRNSYAVFCLKKKKKIPT